MKYLLKPRGARAGRRTRSIVGMLAVVLLAGTLAVPTSLAAEQAPVELNAGAEVNARFELNARAELGIISILHHEIQFGEDGDRFDYRTQGGQEILYPYSRLTGEALFGGRHEVELLYQPLTIRSSTRIPAGTTIRIDDEVFGTTDEEASAVPLDLTYGFDFWRGTYRYRFVDRPAWHFSAGAGLQLRNASIVFDSGDGEQRVVSQDLGPVPVLSTLTRYQGGGGGFVELSAEGFWAPIRYLNLRDVDVNGWLYDGALRAGVTLDRGSEAFISVRLLGGGSDGTGPSPSVWTQSQDEPRYTYNNLTTLALTIGARL